jgi:hypothetical protein
MQESRGHSQTINERERDKSEHQDKAKRIRGTHILFIRVRTPRESRSKSTHFLLITEGREGQDAKTKHKSEGNPLSVRHRGRDNLEYQEKARQQGALTNC